jgi:hypothetical protein
MTNKTEALALAKKYDITIDNMTTTQNGEVFGDLDLVLPKGYTLDNTTGTSVSASGEKTAEFWGIVLDDLEQLVSSRSDWLKHEHAVTLWDAREAVRDLNHAYPNDITAKCVECGETVTIVEFLGS